MDKINLKIKHEPSQFVKNLGTVLFNIFANFFNWFVIIICLAILISGYWWLIRPKYDFIASNQELSFREREYENKVQYLKQLNEVKNLYKSINQADKDKIDSMLSARQDIDRLKIVLLREIGQVGKEMSAPLDNIVITPLDSSAGKFITIGSPVPTNNQLFSKLKLVQISFSVKAVDYVAVKKILARLEKSLRIMDVTKINFDPGARQTSIELLTYHLEQ